MNKILAIAVLLTAATANAQIAPPQTYRVEISNITFDITVTPTVPIPTPDPFPIPEPVPAPDPVPEPQPVPIADRGWTEISTSADSRLVFVSSSSGSDTNSGLDELSPVKTIAKAFSIVRDGYPDHVLLKRGDTFTEGRLP